MTRRDPRACRRSTQGCPNSSLSRTDPTAQRRPSRGCYPDQSNAGRWLGSPVGPHCPSSPFACVVWALSEWASERAASMASVLCGLKRAWLYYVNVSEVSVELHVDWLRPPDGIAVARRDTWRWSMIERWCRFSMWWFVGFRRLVSRPWFFLP